MSTLPTTRTKLIWEPGNPWMLYVDNQLVGEWCDCAAWECGIEGMANGQSYRIDVLNR